MSQFPLGYVNNFQKTDILRVSRLRELLIHKTYDAIVFCELLPPTIPPESAFWQDLTHCDYFSESQKNDGPNIYKDVGAVVQQ